MPFEITKPRQTYSLGKTQTQGALDRYNNSRDNARMQREAAKQVMMQRIYQLKSMMAVELTKELELHAINAANEFIKEAVNALNEGGRTPEEQAFMEQFVGEIAAQFRDIVPTIIHVGATNITQVASQNIEPPEGNRWLR